METKTHAEIQDFIHELTELGKGLFTFTLEFWDSNFELIRTQTIKIPVPRDVFKAYALAQAMLLKNGATDITPLEYAEVSFNDGVKDIIFEEKKVKAAKISTKELEEIELD